MYRFCALSAAKAASAAVIIILNMGGKHLLILLLVTRVLTAIQSEHIEGLFQTPPNKHANMLL